MSIRTKPIALPAFLIILAALASNAYCWGPEAHALITLQAIELLPQEMKPFYEANERYATTLVALPDDWRETHKEIGSQHFLNVDMLDAPPFAKVRVSREEAEKRFGKEKLLEAGLLPWTIEERFQLLVKALKNDDPEEIVVQSALLAHFVGDAHVPFHATKLYDGKTPEQKGLHFRWETNLIALRLKPESVRPAAPAKIDAVLPAAFEWIADSWSYVDAICAADDRAREKDPGHGYRYFTSLGNDTMAILQQRLSSAAQDLAGLYVAAWDKAGKPRLSDKPAPLYWGR